MPLNAKAKRKDIHYIMKKVNDFFSKRLSPVLTNLVLARKQRGCLRRKIVVSEDFMGAAQTRNF